MTEAESLASEDAIEMHCFLWERCSERKFRLLGCHCCRELWPLLEEQSKRAIEVAEQYCDGVANDEERQQSNSMAWDVYKARIGSRERRHAAYAVCLLTAKKPNPAVGHVLNITQREPALRFVKTIRCMFGNPFHPITLDPSWLTSTVVSLANQMYDTRDFSAMPILADALQDSSCDNETILTHCRGPGPHTRGCWVLDLLTGRE